MAGNCRPGGLPISYREGVALGPQPGALGAVPARDVARLFGVDSQWIETGRVDLGRHAGRRGIAARSFGV